MELPVEPLDGLKTQPSDAIYADHKYHLITVLVERTATDTGAMAIFKRLRAMPEFKQGYSVLFDSSQVEVSMVTGDGVFKLAQSFPNDENRFAIVVNNPYSLGLAKAYEACANWKVNRVAVFNSTQAALESLGISD